MKSPYTFYSSSTLTPRLLYSYSELLLLLPALPLLLPLLLLLLMLLLLLPGLSYPSSLSPAACERPLGVSVWLKLSPSQLVALASFGMWSRKASETLIAITT